MQLQKSRLYFVAIFFLAVASCGRENSRGWRVYGGTGENDHYSELTEVDTANVSQLQVAWEYHTGDADTARHSQIQCNPIIVDGVLYGTSPTLRLFALDAATGRQRWVFDPDSASRQKGATALNFILNNNRGVTYWEDRKDKRILYTAGSFLYAVNCIDGTPIRSFGKDGKIDLHEGLGREVKDLYVAATSPGIVYRDLYILGSRVDEGPAAAPGHIRAFDARTGAIRWVFHTIPQPGEFGFDTWEDSIAYKHIGGANSWSGFTLDEKRGILFAPTGSASFDFYGGKRKGANLFANCLLALDAATGKRKWHYQLVHHDIWDRDLPCPPVLVTVNKDQRLIDAVAQPSKHGWIYVFDRETGTPVFPIDEIPIDTATALTGEKIWPTQPIPRLPAPFVRQTFSENDLNPYLSDTALASLKKELAGYRYGKLFLPPGKQTAIQIPGLDGGAEWGGPSYDPGTGTLYINANEMGWKMAMVDRKPTPKGKQLFAEAGLRLYTQNCMSCHGADRKGAGNYPALTGISKRYAPADVQQLMKTGRRMMPAFAHLSDQERAAITSYIMDLTIEKKKLFIPPPVAEDSFRALPYQFAGYYKFMKEGYPAIGPPWGTLTAINLNSGEHLWKTTLGEYPELKAKGIPPTGTENYGGPVVTKGGLLFIAAARDGKLRAYNKRTGKLLWEYSLPAPGFATPSVYRANGKQYLVIACGGGKLGTVSGDSYVAFALGGGN
ncbi:outer membrane protein assembly factor BamB family protein [Sediminibacterium soli]|uniref:outer membrane protein assembly factor BamB family protein n=1 Tax=Sediminibacterium soli TaxID=2698829 RepID=UPI00137948C4|nr:PQQ-binding-like beta-propeller repeat protein [Sediminibacterium soli]NCI48099.1 PQQ-binding-like beta-propeller repeat protein [Sediminibacterium soli]